MTTRWGENWRVPADEWIGQTAYILGGGPSLTDADLGLIPPGSRIIAVKHSFKLAPQADTLFWADDRWLDWDRPPLAAHAATDKVTTLPPPDWLTRDAPIRFVGSRRRYLGDNRLSHDPEMIGGYCSGSGALNLAWLYGSRRMVMIGFDMYGGRWHGSRYEPGDATFTTIKASFEKLGAEITAAGAVVINATPGSALKAFPIMDLASAVKVIGA